MRVGLLGCLLFLGVIFLVPQCTESRTISKRELEYKLWAKLHVRLSSKHGEYKKFVLSKIIFEAKRTSHLDTGMLKVFGRRKTTTAKPKITSTTTTMPTKTTRPTKTTQPTLTMKPNMTTWPTLTAQPSITMKPKMTTRPTANKRRPKWELIYDEGSGSGMSTFEDLIDEDEIVFDEEEMIRDDNDFNGDAAEKAQGKPKEQSDSKPKFPHWSLSYYGIFQLSDSHFCESGYRWSRNVCKTNCSAFLDDDITDDIECLFKSRYWRYLLRHRIY